MADFSAEVAFVLLEGKPVCVGRNPDSHVPLQSNEFPLLASRAHARFHMKDQHLFVEDLKSTNGTYVHDVRLDPNLKVHIRDDVLVSFGGPERVINQGSLCPNPFCFKIRVLRPSPNSPPISVTISNHTPQSANSSAPKPEPVTTSHPPPHMPHHNAVIDLTGVRNGRAREFFCVH